MATLFTAAASPGYSRPGRSHTVRVAKLSRDGALQTVGVAGCGVAGCGGLTIGHGGFGGGRSSNQRSVSRRLAALVTLPRLPS